MIVHSFSKICDVKVLETVSRSMFWFTLRHYCSDKCKSSVPPQVRKKRVWEMNGGIDICVRVYTDTHKNGTNGD